MGRAGVAQPLPTARLCTRLPNPEEQCQVLPGAPALPEQSQICSGCSSSALRTLQGPRGAMQVEGQNVFSTSSKAESNPSNESP